MVRTTPETDPGARGTGRRPGCRSAPHAAPASAFEFARATTVGAGQTARAVFADLEHGAAYAERMIPALATGILVAVIESVCALELQGQLGADETVVGERVDMHHPAPALPGSQLTVRGRAQPGDDGRIRFEVEVDDRFERIASAVVVMRVIVAPRFARRLARKEGPPAM